MIITFSIEFKFEFSDADQDNIPTVFSPVSPPGPVNCIPEDSLPYAFVWRGFCRLISERNQYLCYGDNKIQAKGNSGKYQKALVFIIGIIPTKKSYLYFWL